jgi:hypothetical protein
MRGRITFSLHKCSACASIGLCHRVPWIFDVAGRFPRFDDRLRLGVGFAFALGIKK